MILFTNRTSWKCLINDIIRPKFFTSAQTQFGIHNEQHAINKYVQTWNVNVSKCGLFISIDKGFLSATPDSVVIEQSGEKRGLEVKDLPTFKDIQPIDAYKDKKYPVNMMRKVMDGRVQRVPQLKKKHQYYHQIQLQLHCCPFASFADFVIYHVNVNKIHCERIYPDQEWRDINIPKMEEFYKTKLCLNF